MSAPPAPANDRWLFGAGLIGGLAVVAFVVLPTILAEVTGRGAVAVGGLGTRPAFGLILLLIVAAGLVWLFAHFWRSLPPMPAFSASPGGSAHEILRVRFARGEITQDEYLRMVEVLRT